MKRLKTGYCSRHDRFYAPGRFGQRESLVQRRFPLPQQAVLQAHREISFISSKLPELEIHRRPDA
jgi:hypothetical protein